MLFPAQNAFRLIRIIAIGALLLVGLDLLNAQERLPLHVQEWLTHRDDQVDYARTDSLAAALPPPLPRVIAPTREIIGYLPNWQYDSYPYLDYNLLTQMNYFSAELDASGNITNKNYQNYYWPAPQLISFAHERGVKVKLCATLFDWGGTNNIATLLSSSANRQRAIDNLLAEVLAAGADGVDIDFEPLPASQRANMVTFVEELATAFRSSIPGAVITMAAPAVDWSNAWDLNALAQIVDGLFIMAYDYHWSSAPNAGPVSPLDGSSYTVRSTVNDYLSKTDSQTDKLILGLPYYGYDWPVTSSEKYATTTGSADARLYSIAYSMAQTHGRRWDAASSSPWFIYQSAGWRQVWYDDSLSLALKYQLALEQDLAGVGMWALGYDGDRPELRGALADHFMVIPTAPPSRPTGLIVLNHGDGSVTVTIPQVAHSDSYHVYISLGGTDYIHHTASNRTTLSLTDLLQDQLIYIRVTASNSIGESTPSEVLATVPGVNQSRVLVVNGFDRTSGTVNTFDFVRQHGPPLFNYGVAFDACNNEAVEDALIGLDAYRAVVWISGEEGTATSSFTSREQGRIIDYLKAGGNLMLSGSEIGYDLVEKGTADDRSFYENYLKAIYVSDDAAQGGYTIAPETGALLDGMAQIRFDNGQHGTYDVDYPDGIRPTGDARLIARYEGINPIAVGGAGISYEGRFLGGTLTGRLVHLAVGFEAIYPEDTRNQLMSRIMDFFQVQSEPDDTVKIRRFVLHQNYPNPFRTSTTIPYDILEAGNVRLSVYDLKGSLVRILVSDYLPANNYTYEFSPVDIVGRQLASGIYFVTMRMDKGKWVTRKMILQK